MIFSGHFHNGLIPNYLDKMIHGNFGLISYGRLFPRNARGEKEIVDNIYGFISSPITTFSKLHHLFSKLNVLYTPVDQKVLAKKI